MAQEIQFWGVLAPIDKPVIWNNQKHSVSFHLLTADEELDLWLKVAEYPEPQRLMAEGMIRCAYSVVAVDGKRVEFKPPKPPMPPGFEGMEDKFQEEMARIAGFDVFKDSPQSEFDKKMDWIGGWPGTLLDAVLNAYREASEEPLKELARLGEDPN